jgi:chromosome segregation ATPase
MTCYSSAKLAFLRLPRLLYVQTVLESYALTEAEWPDEFTREEMLEQQSHLLIEECHMLQKELSRYRKNMAKLIGMHAEANDERDKLRAQLKKTELQLSDCRRESSALGNRVAGLESCRDQLEAIHKAQRMLSDASKMTSYKTVINESSGLPAHELPATSKD